MSGKKRDIGTDRPKDRERERKKDREIEKKDDGRSTAPNGQDIKIKNHYKLFLLLKIKNLYFALNSRVDIALHKKYFR